MGIIRRRIFTRRSHNSESSKSFFSSIQALLKYSRIAVIPLHLLLIVLINTSSTRNSEYCTIKLYNLLKKRMLNKETTYSQARLNLATILIIQATPLLSKNMAESKNPTLSISEKVRFF